MKVAIITNYTYVSPWKEKWEEQTKTWIPKAKELGIPVYTLIANSNIEGDYLQVENFIHYKGKSRFLSNPVTGGYVYDISQSYGTNAALKWAHHQNLDYVLLIDNDVFVEPTRFLNLIKEYSQNPEINYAGHCIPYPGLDYTKYPKQFQPISPDKLYYASGGAGMLLSKKSIALASSSFIHEVELYPNEKHKGCNDLILGLTLAKHHIPLYQDGRFFIDFPDDKPRYLIPGHFDIPYIGDKNSPLVCQHNANGNMVQIIKDLQWS